VIIITGRIHTRGNDTSIISTSNECETYSTHCTSWQHEANVKGQHTTTD